MSLRVVKQFASVSMQGGPQTGLRRFGVPPGGAFDPESLALANALLGLPPETPGLEVMGGSIEVEALADCTVSVVGAVKTQERRVLRRGERFDVQLGPVGHVYYLGSCPSLIGSAYLEQPPTSLDANCLRVVLFHSGVALPPNLIVTHEISRIGVKLSGAIDRHRIENPSEPACVGTIQITPDGTAILIGPDGPTIGGYPKAGVVCSADLGKIAQLRPGSAITLDSITVSEARRLAAASHSELARRIQMLRLASQTLAVPSPEG
jgi:allophanate hydrolase subunit 2